jgi:hypothetical protein
LRSHGFQGLADAWSALDTIFYHVDLYDSEEWSRRLDNAGFTVRSVETLTSRRNSWVFDALLYPSLVGWVTKR